MPFRILHLSTDEKFIKLQHDLFEAVFPGDNEFRILRRDGHDLTYIQPSERMVPVEADYFLTPAGIADIATSDCVIFHGMPRFRSVAERLPDTTLVVWVAWGVEYYRLLEERYGNAHLPSTQAYLRSRTFWKPLRALISPSTWARPRTSRLKQTAALLAALMPRIDAVNINIVDHERLTDLLPDFNAVWHHLGYYTVEDTFSRGPPGMDGPDILVGNSATSTNNHIEAFEALRKLDLKGRRIVVPLSYGDAGYGDHIARLGTEMFGTVFLPLREFLALDDYNRVIASCGTVVMNHTRQQAYGNISSALYNGARVYLRPENPLLEVVARLGATAHPMSELDRESGSANYGETADIRVRNFEAMERFWSREHAYSQIRKLRDLHQQRLARV